MSNKTELMQNEKSNAVAEPVQDTSLAMVQALERAATDPNVDVTKMERLWDMHQKISARQAEMQFNSAMTEAQSEMRPIAADASNPQTRSKYASYAALDKKLRPIYTGAGFALSFDTGESPLESHVRVLCYVSHKSGHSRTYHADMPADGKGAKGGDVMTKTHAAGSAMSYGMRYLLKLIFNVAIGEDDDDGNKAGGYSYITADQAANLESLAEEVGADKKKFLAYWQVSKFEDFSTKQYANAVKSLEAKRK